MSRRRKVSTRILAAVPLTLLACAGAPRAKPPALPADGERVAFEVPGHGSLELAVPPGWVAEVGAGEPPAPVTIRLRRRGETFLALVTPFWNPGEPEDEPARADTAQLFAELARRKALAGAVEREIALEELVGEEVHGFYFAATDRELVGKEPGPEEWRHLLQGAAAVGPLVVAFTLLDNGPGRQRSAFLELIRGARHLAAGGEGEGEQADAPGGMELDPDVRTVPLRVALPGRAWAVLVDLPDFRMFKPHLAEAGSMIVLGQSQETLIVASVVLRPAGEARDARACRDADLGRVRERVSGLGELRLSEVGPTARVVYAVADRGRQEHAHAWLHRDGVCANVHVSKIDPEAADGERMELILGSVRFGEDL